jgi:hypothetical protein
VALFPEFAGNKIAGITAEEPYETLMVSSGSYPGDIQKRIVW